MAHINDFREWSVVSNKGKKSSGKYRESDKGHRALVKAFLESVREGSAAPIPVDQIFETMLSTFAVQQALREGRSLSPEDIGTMEEATKQE